MCSEITTRDTRDATARGRLRAALAPALLIACQVGLFGPAAVYVANRSDFSHSFGALVQHLLPAMAATIVALTLIAAFVRGAPGRVYRALLLALGLLLWIQGTFLLPDVGLLDGSDPDWDAHAWRTPREVALWVVVLVAAVVFHRRVARVAPLVAGALLATQALPVALAAVQGKLAATATTSAAQPPAELFQLSQAPGALVLVLDGFQSDVFGEIIDDPQHADLRQALNGFVFFADHAGAFPTTKPSIPAMLSGRRYENDQPRSAYFAAAYGPHSVFQTLADDGFEIDMVSLLEPAIRGPLNHRFRLTRPYATPAEAEWFAAAQLADLSLFRHAPNPLKPAVFNGQAWRVQARSPVRRRRYQATTGQAFLTELTDRMTTVARPPTISYFHVGIPHLPAVLDAECGDIPPQSATRQAFTAQATCAVRLLVGVLDRLRGLGIYDQTAIIVAADHGVMFRPPGLVGDPMYLANMPWVISRAMPLLLVKAPGRREPLVRSMAPTSMTDLPATLLDLLGRNPGAMPGIPALRLDPSVPRTRAFSAYHWRKDDWEGEYFEALHRLDIRGPVLDAASWHYRDTVFAPGLDLTAERIDFGTARSRRYQGLGWADGPRVEGRPTQWAVGAQSVLTVALPTAAVVLEATLHAPTFHSPQTIDIEVDGQPVARWQPAVGGMGRMQATIPADPERPATSALVFRFERFGKRGDDPRPLAVLFDDIVLRPE